ncbi:Stp1/IreP family PP2C-type Ser/Thr phosphatase [Pelotomaculum isophthalicicum JI]|uniref:Stp1/IreP family PP2C-type Ser/Thr phosphatase n=1 Tax=Pelotomaculum isophthalicicum JI TaxID=947010 RepID=A0A9X4JT51_9FIRM|nr:Stp1/IreP family PP2C-type Ser/Thr phosphatase [Pelotomaculum isophthalicicum]MDF9408154.1 Stp1/IreP family PP2C-type Ser/Thr phosphatase [Pelotomaculum isophthalicicum JI]
MRWAQITDTGLSRKDNEDSLLVSPDMGLLAVADGMGGHQGGEVASGLALQTLEKELARSLKKGESPEKALLDSVRLANIAVFELSGRNKELHGMGTTITACLKREDDLIIAHVGDSRAYLICRGSIRQLTQDHSLVQELLRNGGISEEQALQHPQRNLLTRALGTEQSVEVDHYRYKVVANDLLLLCTDGLTRYLRQEDLLYIINSSKDIDAAVHVLLDKALHYGGADNITIILAQF